jgi:hypothetical protein
MTPLAWMWLLSALGALTFYGAGYFGARLRRQHTVEVVVPRHHDTSDTNPGAEAAALRRDLATIRAEKVALATEVAQLAAQARQAHDRADRAGRESQVLRAELKAATEAAPARQRRPQTAAEVQEMALELEALRGRVAEAEALRSDNALLRAAAVESDAQATRIAELESELQVARAHAFAAAPAPAPRQPAPPRLRSVPEASTEQSLQQVIDRVARLPGVRAVALADDLGLLVAGAGDHGTALAAYGGFLAGVGTRAREHLPLTGLKRCAVEDENSTTICVSPLRGAPLMLVTMSSGTGPSQQQVARLLEDAARVVA